jgi:TetR/AcrR family transcriptional repressor of bet genes
MTVQHEVMMRREGVLRAAPLRLKKPPERTASKEVRQHQLIEATIVEIAERGLSSFKLSDVAKTAGVAVGMVNFHFTTKAQLLDHTLDYLSDEYLACWRHAIATAGADPAVQLWAMMLSDFDAAVCTRRRIAAWHAFYGEARARPAYRERCAINELERHAVLTKICAGVIRRGRYKGRNADLIARTLAAITDGIWLDILLSGGRVDRDGAKLLINDYLKAIFPRDFPRNDDPAA